MRLIFAVTSGRSEVLHAAPEGFGRALCGRDVQPMTGWLSKLDFASGLKQAEQTVMHGCQRCQSEVLAFDQRLRTVAAEFVGLSRVGTYPSNRPDAASRHAVEVHGQAFLAEDGWRVYA